MLLKFCRCLRDRPDRTSGGRLLFAVLFGAAFSVAAHAETIKVAAGGDLQAALASAKPGDTVELPAGATFIGTFTLPKKDGDAFIVVRSEGVDDTSRAGRATPTMKLARLQAPANAPALQTGAGAHHWRIESLEIAGATTGNLVELGDGSDAQRSLELVPHDLVIDRCYIHGDAGRGARRCVALNSATTTVRNSHISDCKAEGEDGQAIAGWNGPGPFQILDNYLEGAGENILFGGADPAIENLVPSGITIRGNLIAKPPSWRGTKWQVKNLLELKNARNVTIDGNVLEYNWQAAQSGFAVLFTVRNQDGRCGWCQVEQVAFTNNILRHIAAGIEILGKDDNHPSKQTSGITIKNNLISDVDPTRWGGNGYALQVLGGPRDVTMDHNTIIQEHAMGLVQVEGPHVAGFAFTNNVAQQGAYGIIGQDHAPGNDTIATFFPRSIFAGNVIGGGESSRYPSHNQYPSVTEFRRQFVSYDGADYHLTRESSWRGSATDREDVGVNFATLARPADVNASQTVFSRR
jgi:hypothetical protein